MRIAFSFFFLCALFFFTACTQTLSQNELDSRTEQLYAHTKLMIELTNESELQSLGLDASAFKKQSFHSYSTQEMLEILSQSYAIPLSGNNEGDLLLLEEKMVDMMLIWEGNIS